MSKQNDSAMARIAFGLASVASATNARVRMVRAIEDGADDADIVSYGETAIEEFDAAILSLRSARERISDLTDDFRDIANGPERDDTGPDGDSPVRR